MRSLYPTFLSPRRSVAALCLTFFALLFSGCETTSNGHSKNGYVSRFGVMSLGDDGKYHVFAETTQIHRLVDQNYVHGFEVARKGGSRFLGHFVVHFPEPIKITPDVEKAYTVRDGGRTLESPEEIYWGLYSSPFWFSADDPLGPYSIDVYIDGELYRTFSYEVVPFGNDVTF